ncbi:ABC-2 transporter permease [Blautia sp.]|uniref:ABC-2 transporter permease n=1 Tax=Blautia sp. TaxID=1955243 RepID=UPI00261B245B|nr:ABC-2 transporter permease [Blautia sp.]MEE0810343.1 ABC-2 transporter permease [Blautia sp.]
MKGLFIKDLRLMKNQRNFLITLALMFLVLIVTGVDASFFMGYVPFLLLIVTMSTITYDEQDNSMGFLMALPVSRQTYVLEKYLLSASFGVGGFAVTFVIFLITEKAEGSSMTSGDYLLVFMGFLVFVILFLSLMIPIQLKFGSEKGRMVLFAIFFGIIGLVYLVNKVLTVDFTQTAFYQTITQLPMGILMAIALVLFVIFVFISAKISLGVMKKKEF